MFIKLPCEDVNSGTSKGQLQQYEVIGIESRTEIDRKKTFSLSFPIMNASSTPSDLGSPTEGEAEESGTVRLSDSAFFF